MAQTLLYGSEVLAGFPDNTAGLITPEDVRAFTVSSLVGQGFLETTTQITVPIISGTPVAVNPLLTGITTAGDLWLVDGNNNLTPDYATKLTDTIIPAGYNKLCRFVSIMSLQKVGGGTDTYEFTFTEDAVPVGTQQTVIYAGTNSLVVTSMVTRSVDISVAPVFGITIEGVGTGEDMNVLSFEMSVSDAMLNAPPP